MSSSSSSNSKDPKSTTATNNGVTTAKSEPTSPPRPLPPVITHLNSLSMLRGAARKTEIPLVFIRRLLSALPSNSPGNRIKNATAVVIPGEYGDLARDLAANFYEKVVALEPDSEKYPATAREYDDPELEAYIDLEGMGGKRSTASSVAAFVQEKKNKLAACHLWIKVPWGLPQSSSAKQKETNPGVWSATIPTCSATVSEILLAFDEEKAGIYPEFVFVLCSQSEKPALSDHPLEAPAYTIWDIYTQDQVGVILTHARKLKHAVSHADAPRFVSIGEDLKMATPYPSPVSARRATTITAAPWLSLATLSETPQPEKVGYDGKTPSSSAGKANTSAPAKTGGSSSSSASASSAALTVAAVTTASAFSST